MHHTTPTPSLSQHPFSPGIESCYTDLRKTSRRGPGGAGATAGEGTEGLLSSLPVFLGSVVEGKKR